MGKKLLKNTEWVVLIVSVTLAIIGLIALFSATQNTELAEFKKTLGIDTSFFVPEDV